MSYATGQDPRIYLQVAEYIRANGYSFATIVRCTTWFVPGYPLLLAGILDTLGIFAAYWINLPIFFCGVWLLALTLRRFASPRETGLTMLIFFWISITGHPLNPHYLFLPFRGILEWTWMFGAMALMMPAFDPVLSDGSRCRRAALTALWLMAGALFRETILFLIFPFGLVWLWQGVRGDRGAWKGLAAMAAAPLLTAIALIGWKGLAHEPLMNAQANRWMVGLMRGGFAKPFPLLLGDIVRLIFGELGFSGLIFLAVGTGWAVARREKSIFTLWTTSILLVLFYAVYKSHVRYTLSAVGLLALVAGWGFAVTLSAATRRLRPAWRGGSFAVAALVVVALTLRAIAGMETWGPRVTRADVNSLRKNPVAAELFVFVERDNRHLVDALLAFTKVSPKDPVMEGAALTNFQGALFIRPSDDKGRTAIQQGVKGEDWLEWFFDLEPTGNKISLGESVSEVYRLAAWSNDTVSFGVSVRSGERGGVLWLDFKAGNGAEVVQLAMRGGEDAASTVELNRPAGLTPVWVPSDLLRGSNLSVYVRSPLPLPADLDPVFVPAGTMRWFRMEQGRLPSAIRMLGKGFENQPIFAKHGATWRTHAVLRLPSLAGLAPLPSQVAVTVRLVPRPLSSAHIQGTLAGADDASSAVAWRISAQEDHQQSTWKGKTGRLGVPPALELSADPLPSDCWYLRVEQMGIAFSGGE
jgi:hypothetical protein